MLDQTVLDQVMAYLSSVRKLTPECIADLNAMVKHQGVKKNQILLRIGEVNDRLWFIFTGAVSCFYYVQEEEVPGWFFFEKAMVVSISSFYRQKPSPECLVAFEAGSLLYITHDQYEALCARHHCFADLARILLQDYVEIFYDHGRVMRKHEGGERYRIVQKKLSDVISRIPVSALASWLGITRRTIERNRKKKPAAIAEQHDNPQAGTSAEALNRNR